MSLPELPELIGEYETDVRDIYPARERILREHIERLERRGGAGMKLSPVIQTTGYTLELSAEDARALYFDIARTLEAIGADFAGNRAKVDAARLFELYDKLYEMGVGG